MKKICNLHLYLSIIIFLFLSVLSGCGSVQSHIDKNGFKKTAERLSAKGGMESPGDFREYIRKEYQYKPFSLNSADVKPLESHCINYKDEKNLIQEILIFDTEMPGGTEKAYFYIYRHGKWGERPVVLWIPGMGVSRTAFILLDSFLFQLLDRGFDVLFYVPPFHLEREKENQGKDPFFNVSHIRNIEMIRTCVREVLTGYDFLKKQGVEEINAWGGSMGASFIFTASSFVDFKHIWTLIPVLDWSHTLVDHPDMKPVLEESFQAGYTYEELKKAYTRISPVAYNYSASSENILIMYGKYDQLTLESKTLEFISNRSITHYHGYRRSHSTILFSPRVFKDFGKYLDTMIENEE